MLIQSPPKYLRWNFVRKFSKILFSSSTLNLMGYSRTYFSLKKEIHPNWYILSLMSQFNRSILWGAVLQRGYTQTDTFYLSWVSLMILFYGTLYYKVKTRHHHFFFLSFEVNTLKKIGASVTWHMLKYINIGGLEKQVLFMLCLKTWNKFRFWNKSRPEFRSDKTEKT